MPIALRKENDKLRSDLARRDTTIVDRDATIVDREATIDKLARDLAVLEKHIKSMRAGRVGYSVDEGQGLLFSTALEQELSEAIDAATDALQDDESSALESEVDGKAEAKNEESSKPKKSRKIDTSGLPCEERVHELAEEMRFCPATGQALIPVGEKVFEELDYKRAQLCVIRHRRIIYGLSAEESEHREATPVTAPMPARPLKNCRASATLLSWLLVQKYCNHLPLYRQEQIFGRDGLKIPRQTLCDWTLRAAEALQPIADCLMDRIRAGPIMQLDDTPVKCQGGKGKKNFQSYLWSFVSPEVDGIAFRFTPNRKAELLAQLLGDFEGILVGDGYSGNHLAAKLAPGEIKLAGCFAHVTRKFRDAESEAAGTAKLFREDIKKLYAIEKEADDAELSPEARQDLRKRNSRPILASLFARARRLKNEYSDAGLMAKAIGYLINQRKTLVSFLVDGRVPLDNNACERSIRPIAIGRRNWLFAGSLRGGKAAAIIYTLIESCRLAKIDMVSYLADVLTRVGTQALDDVENLTPVRWNEALSQSDSI
jgi:transposase